MYLFLEPSIVSSMLEGGAWGLLCAVLLILYFRRDKQEKEMRLEILKDRQLLIAEIEKSEKECEERYKELKAEFIAHKKEYRDFQQHERKEMSTSMNNLANAVRQLIKQHENDQK